jgi:TolA-binding protein
MTRSLTYLFRVLLLGLMVGASSLVLALPTPKDIEASVQAGQFERAETQLREVIKARPTSAKAHYELGQVLARQGRFILFPAVDRT